MKHLIRLQNEIIVRRYEERSVVVKDLRFLLQFCDIDTPKCLNLESAGLLWCRKEWV